MKASPLKLVVSGAIGVSDWCSSLADRYTPPDVEFVRGVLDFVIAKHGDDRTRQGTLLRDHICAVAGILSELKLDRDAIAAGLLFRVAEAPDDVRAIRDRFGATVSDLAEGARRMGGMGALLVRLDEGAEQQQMQLERLRKMLLAMVQDIRVVLIKLADHLQVLRATVKHPDDGLRRETAELTRDVYAPLANRLGVWQIKWEMEDLTFRLLEPETYKHIARLLDEKRVDRERYIETVIAMLKGELARAGIHAEVTGRPKHIYSIYRKMQRKGLDFDALYDVRAVRIMVASVAECYAVLGLVHNLWSPLSKEFDDYIAKPKSNDYRSLHTAVTGPGGKAVEIQIRTPEMHQHAELGVAAHWRYKEGGGHDRGYDEKIAWLRQVLDWKDEIGDAGELAAQFRTGLFEDTVYVLTPQGRVIDLPKGATPIDFAYHVHTDLGHRCRGAKVDGAMVPLNTPLSNGQQVEIMAGKQGGPSRDWLNPALGYLHSPTARAKVRQWFNKLNLESDVTNGRAVLDRELQRQGLTSINLDRVAANWGGKLNDFLASIGRNEVGPRQIQELLHATAAPGEEPVIDPQPEAIVRRRSSTRSKGSVLVVGVDKLLTLPAKCCKPVPPDPIVGFVTRGRGVSVHRADCSNVARLDRDRLVTAEWGDATGAVFPVEISVEAVDRPGLLRDISEILTRERANVNATSTLTTDHVARMRFTIEIANVDQLQRVLKLVREVKGVLGATRR